MERIQWECTKLHILGSLFRGEVNAEPWKNNRNHVKCIRFESFLFYKPTSRHMNHRRFPLGKHLSFQLCLW